MRVGILAGVLSISIATSGLVSAPAAADEDLAKVLLGVAVTGIIAHEIAKRNEERNAAEAAAEKSSTASSNRNCSNPVWDGEQWVNRSGQRCAVQTAAASMNRTPAVCLQERWINDRLVKYFDRRCMQTAGFRLSFDK